ncbi:hypothetical protein P167DRAFT_571209 [Morchella conica CCBAS932]|uniref:Uncharacterized protein n=1 Tax=Morchella conica CCBAS932 TaxID=1392247 RepID=A0A3N4KYE3_9PEZI|nr:hypothetical protein P167DRAFT_571209 [Morchella conica CCBAS932]
MASPVKSTESSSEIPIGIKDVEEWSIIAIIRHANSIEYKGPMLPVIDKFLKEVKEKYEMNKYRMHSGTYHKACLALEAFEKDMELFKYALQMGRDIRENMHYIMEQTKIPDMKPEEKAAEMQKAIAAEREEKDALSREAANKALKEFIQRQFADNKKEKALDKSAEDPQSVNLDDIKCNQCTVPVSLEKVMCYKCHVDHERSILAPGRKFKNRKEELKFREQQKIAERREARLLKEKEDSARYRSNNDFVRECYEIQQAQKRKREEQQDAREHNVSTVRKARRLMDDSDDDITHPNRYYAPLRGFCADAAFPSNEHQPALVAPPPPKRAPQPSQADDNNKPTRNAQLSALFVGLPKPGL